MSDIRVTTKPYLRVFLLVISALISGALIALASALEPIWWTAWLGPTLLICTASLTPMKWRRSLIMLAGLVGGISMFSYHVMISGWFGAMLILVLKAYLWTYAVKLATAYIDRGNAALAILSVPAAFAAIDTFLIYLSPHGSVSSLAYSQMDALPVIQMASLGGVPAISFFVLTGASLFGVLIAHFAGHRVSKLARTAVIFGGIVLGGLIFGSLRIQTHNETTGRQVTMISIDSSEPDLTNWDEFWEMYGPEVTRAAKTDAIILLPEAIVELSEAEAGNAAKFMLDFAVERQATIIIGIFVDEGDKITNRALVVEPNGNPQWYNKQYLIPGLESDVTPGSTPFISATGLGVAICKDMHFPILGRDYVSHGAQLFLVLANDFRIDDWMMSRVTALRGVETGVSVARTARNGLSSVSDPYGRFIGESRSKNHFTTLTLQVPKRLPQKTFYARFGDLFGFLCLVLWLTLIVIDRRYKKRI